MVPLWNKATPSNSIKLHQAPAYCHALHRSCWDTGTQDSCGLQSVFQIKQWACALVSVDFPAWCLYRANHFKVYGLDHKFTYFSYDWVTAMMNSWKCYKNWQRLGPLHRNRDTILRQFFRTNPILKYQVRFPHVGFESRILSQMILLSNLFLFLQSFINNFFFITCF